MRTYQRRENFREGRRRSHYRRDQFRNNHYPSSSHRGSPEWETSERANRVNITKRSEKLKKYFEHERKSSDPKPGNSRYGEARSESRSRNATRCTEDKKPTLEGDIGRSPCRDKCNETIKDEPQPDNENALENIEFPKREDGNMGEAETSQRQNESGNIETEYEANYAVFHQEVHTPFGLFALRFIWRNLSWNIIPVRSPILDGGSRYRPPRSLYGPWYRSPTFPINRPPHPFVPRNPGQQMNLLPPVPLY